MNDQKETTGACVNPACDMYEEQVPIKGDAPARCPMCRGPLKPKEPAYRPKEA